MKNSETYILIADSHLSEGMKPDFFAMLDRIREYQPKGVVFLGDIFELWIALDGYESDLHRRFLDWCREAKQHFEVGFILGNHEFYVCETHADAFTWISRTGHNTGEGFRFIHGDLINRADHSYRLLRCLLRNAFTRFLLKITAKKIGPKVADHVRVSLKPTNKQHKRLLPMKYLKKMSQKSARKKLNLVFSGHFHRYAELDFYDGIKITILPAWFTAEEIILVTPDLHYVCGPWQELLSDESNKSS